jgi:CDP-glucose 4,6-dehydratase
LGLGQGPLEGVGLIMFGDTYRGRRVLLTGHTGFKGSWLALWLQALEADVSGLALAPATNPSHWDLLNLDMADHRVDVRDASSVSAVVQAARPEIIFHLAAQPLVRRSYRDPLETWSTNVMGTANLLEACRQQSSVRAIVVVTTDKCYENHEWEWGYRENDRLGGHDPYSASKAAAELVVASYRKSFFDSPDAPLLASARAGNVIGGGDWSEDRLIPDLVRAVGESRSLEIRSPDATRPWQHVLESLAGYLILGQTLLTGDRAGAQAWNFGPDAEGNQTVCEVLARLKNAWPALTWNEGTEARAHEATLLHLDSTLARKRLGWRPVWSLDDGLAATASWYRAQHEQGELLSTAQLRDYMRAAEQAGHTWACK